MLLQTREHLQMAQSWLEEEIARAEVINSDSSTRIPEFVPACHAPSKISLSLFSHQLGTFDCVA